MINDTEILKEIKDIKRKTEILANPANSGHDKAACWADVNVKLMDVEYDIEKIINKLFDIK